MPWFKVDDKLHDHRKARAAGSAAMGVWVLAGSWAADNLTDGFIPASLLPRWGRQREANRLVEVGLWHPAHQDGEDGWRFHEWAERQPTRAQKLAEREAKALAGRRGGLASGQSRREAKTKQDASGLVELPSRPVPSKEPSSEIADAIPDAESRPEVARICTHLATRIEGHGIKRPTIGKRWHDAARLMLDKDGYSEAQVLWLIDKAHDDEFWRANILSLPKLREKADQLRLKFAPRPVDAEVRHNDDGTVDETSLPPVEDSWMRRRPTR